MDLRTGWDFNLESHRQAAFKYQDKYKPWVLIGSPKCSFASTLQRLSRDSPEWRKTLREGLTHLIFVCQLYKRQILAGRKFLHEHPRYAASWDLYMVREVEAMEGVLVVDGDQCCFGQWGTDNLGEALCLKATRWMTNDEHMAAEVGKRCTNFGQQDKRLHHRHVMLIGGRARAMEHYPERLVAAILRGIRASLIANCMIGAVECGAHVDEAEPFQLNPEWYGHVTDVYTGLELEPTLVAEAKMKEMTFMRTLGPKGVWSYDTTANCLAKTGKQPVPCDWVCHSKGDTEHPDVRCRLVIQETKRRSAIEVEDIAAVFSATPPYEGLRMLTSFVMTPQCEADDDDVMCFIDISRAHPNCPMDRDLWMHLPPEDPRYGEEGVCAKLEMNLYGNRTAGRSFELKVGADLTALDFTQGLMNPCLFYNKERRLKAYVHGDNFVVGGSRAQTAWFAAELNKTMMVNVEGTLGPDSSQGDVQHMICLNRIFTWVHATADSPTKILIEADPRHVDLILKDLGLNKPGTKSVSTPGVKAKDGHPGLPLPKAETTPFRSTTMRVNYLAEDRPDIRYSGKECARFMAEPTNVAHEALKRTGRYLVSHRR